MSVTSAASGLRKVVAASMAGTVVEWYEFFLYGTAATLVFNKVFFAKGTSDLDAILAAFITYAVGFAARPLGGVVFGHFGDKYGRKKLLQFSLVLVGASTFLMGCLPTFGQIGYWAPALLVVLRFLQGFAVGGEWGGAVLLVAEHSPNRERGFWASWPQAGVPVGNMLATVVLLTLTATLSETAFLSWGWRVGVLAVRGGGAGRLLHPDQGHRCADLRRSAAGGRATQGQFLRRRRGPEALSPWGFHRDGPACRREHHVLPGGHVLDHLSQGARCTPTPATSSGGYWSRTQCTSSSSRRPAALSDRLRPQAGLPGRRDRSRCVGLLRLPDDEQRPLPADHGLRSSSAWSSTP